MHTPAWWMQNWRATERESRGIFFQILKIFAQFSKFSLAMLLDSHFYAQLSTYFYKTQLLLDCDSPGRGFNSI